MDGQSFFSGVLWQTRNAAFGIKDDRLPIVADIFVSLPTFIFRMGIFNFRPCRLHDSCKHHFYFCLMINENVFKRLSEAF